MLTITPQASEVIRGVLAAENTPEGAVLRISSQPGAGLAVQVADSPQPDDQIVAGEDVEICLEPSAAEMLDDKELDATLVGDQATFSVGQQSS